MERAYPLGATRVRRALALESGRLQKKGWLCPVATDSCVRSFSDINLLRLPPAARANARYAIGKYVTMPATDLRNPTKFEEILASEHELVFTLMVHDDIHHVDPAQPVWRLKPGSRPIGNHFMLMVGYDSRRKFFTEPLGKVR